MPGEKVFKLLGGILQRSSGAIVGRTKQQRKCQGYPVHYTSTNQGYSTVGAWDLDPHHRCVPCRISPLGLEQPDHRGGAHLPREHRPFSITPGRSEKPEKC